MIKVLEGVNQIQRLFQIRVKIKKLIEAEENLSADIVTHLKTYGTLKQDEWSAVINVVSTCRPKWKEEFIKECGIKKSELILKNTKPSLCEKVELYVDGFKATY